MWQNNFFLAWIDWSRFGKKLIAFDFDENLTQSVAQVTIWYHVSKDFLPLHFAVSQVLSVSEYDLKNGRMLCKQKYYIKNMAVRIPDFCPASVYFADLKTIYFASCLYCGCKLF